MIAAPYEEGTPRDLAAVDGGIGRRERAVTRGAMPTPLEVARAAGYRLAAAERQEAAEDLALAFAAEELLGPARWPRIAAAAHEVVEEHRRTLRPRRHVDRARVLERLVDQVLTVVEGSVADA